MALRENVCQGIFIFRSQSVKRVIAPLLVFIEGFISGLNPNQKAIVGRLHALLIDYPGVHVKERYKLPFYYRHSWISYVNPIGAKGVELCFLKGSEMSNFDGALKSKNRNMVAGITILHSNEINFESISIHFREALIFDKKKK